MEDIIAGRFETDDEARSAAASLTDLVSESDMFIFFNNQPGAHDSDRSPGDERAAESGAKGAATGAASGAIAAGAAGTVAGGPAAGAVAAAVGGYTGSLAGTAGGLTEGEAKKAPRSRLAGMMLAIRVANADNKQEIIDRLRRHGAADIEIAKGKWGNGEWLDFDPMASPQLVY
ncbi:hypothetical protein SAMN05216386_2667 [Nitrosospira briensis]|uniref:Uncharacterized protein n=1 Tax=Nitrosospira briensis TaxID=35799 RepID=A0A1I5EM61_9PROT|nr:hypothetical protein [Nitrosospira briensis]SFO12131.1 hypothetical protein SAMN05216386_2667 [Nitrosospira briensis]